MWCWEGCDSREGCDGREGCGVGRVWCREGCGVGRGVV